MRIFTFKSWKWMLCSILVFGAIVLVYYIYDSFQTVRSRQELIRRIEETHIAISIVESGKSLGFLRTAMGDKAIESFTLDWGRLKTEQLERDLHFLFPEATIDKVLTVPNFEDYISDGPDDVPPGFIEYLLREEAARKKSAEDVKM